MSFYSIVTVQDLIRLRKLAQQQKEERALKIKNRILEQTHNVKLVECLSRITKKLDKVKESTRELRQVVKETNTLQLAIENTHNALPIENERIQASVILDTSLENTLNNMKTNTCFFNIEERDSGDITWNGFPVEKMGGNKPKINEKIYNITPGTQNFLTDTSNIPLKKLDKDREKTNGIIESLNFETYKAILGESRSGRYKQSKTNFIKRNFESQGVKTIIPSNIIDIYTRLEVLLVLKLSCPTNTLTEASNLFDQLYTKGEIQNEQQNRNALDKFST